MNRPPTDEAIRTGCCVAGGGPAGMMLGFLLARAGVDVIYNALGAVLGASWQVAEKRIGRTSLILAGVAAFVALIAWRRRRRARTARPASTGS